MHFIIHQIVKNIKAFVDFELRTWRSIADPIANITNHSLRLTLNKIFGLTCSGQYKFAVERCLLANYQFLSLFMAL